jgi:hypothetical protein
MKKRTGLHIIALLLVGVMLLLSCHIHPHHFWDCGEDDHCPLCQILHSGFTFTSSFELIQLWIIITELIVFAPVIVLKLFSPTGCDNRAPPVNLFFN